ncbi:olfactory receptor 52I2-like [Pteropus alecto]|uniref:olfactory receptor 52I2-like n=1 Tax=Pteropus alecto TaxID=9402 RepID=UPI0007687400|nr:olfactory receptor 52I2-like [Pteropus alecto]
MLGPPYNHTMETPATFYLVGIPGLPSSHLWLAITLSTMYTIALLGNTLIVTVIWMDYALQEPMYYFLCVLAIVDIVMASSVVPKMVNIFTSGDGSISFNACFTQMYFVHATTAVETGLLLAMAFDRYVAICKPLHYKRILTPQVMLGMTVTITIRAVITMTPFSWLVSHLPFCGPNVVLHSYCEHIAVAKLASAQPFAKTRCDLLVQFIFIANAQEATWKPGIALLLPIRNLVSTLLYNATPTVTTFTRKLHQRLCHTVTVTICDVQLITLTTGKAINSHT